MFNDDVKINLFDTAKQPSIPKIGAWNMVLILTSLILMIGGSYNVINKKFFGSELLSEKSPAVIKSKQINGSNLSRSQPHRINLLIKQNDRAVYTGAGADSENGFIDNIWSYSANELIEQLTMIGGVANSELTAEDIADLTDTLRQLASQGEIAIPAISAYLDTMDDIDYQSFAGNHKSAYRSLRLALIDTLHRIGGNEAEEIFFNTLKKTRIPLELLQLGRYLNEFDSNRYKNEIIRVSRQVFNSVTDDGIDGHDVGPLFQLFHDNGGEEIVSELEQVSQLKWGQYASVALAELPHSTGIPSLVRLVDNAPGTFSADFALQMLAQHAENPDAQSALIESIRKNDIPDSLWPKLTQLIAGTYTIRMEDPRDDSANSDNAPLSVERLVSFTPGGGQTLYGVYTPSAHFSSEQIEQRMQLIEAMLDASSDPAQKNALYEAYDRLASMLTSISP